MTKLHVYIIKINSDFGQQTIQSLEGVNVLIFIPKTTN